MSYTFTIPPTIQPKALHIEQMKTALESEVKKIIEIHLLPFLADWSIVDPANIPSFGTMDKCLHLSRSMVTEFSWRSDTMVHTTIWKEFMEYLKKELGYVMKIQGVPGVAADTEYVFRPNAYPTMTTFESLTQIGQN